MGTDRTAQLGQAYPGHFVLGLGVGHPRQAASVGRDFGSPVATARAYLEELGDPPYPRLLGANGPKMLATAGEFADGALPAGAPLLSPRRRGRYSARTGSLSSTSPTRRRTRPQPLLDAVRQHLAAGADHVVVGMSSTIELAVAIDGLVHLAPTIAQPRPAVP